MSKRLRAAHFLLHADLAYSPPNEAIVTALLEQGYEVDLFAPGRGMDVTMYGARVRGLSAEYGRRWLIQNALRPSWRAYSLFSATSENPLAVAGVLARLHRRPSFLLVDEIMSGSYSGDAPASWKALCRWSMRQARFNIVNDASRVELLRDYAAIDPHGKIMIYPGCFVHPPTGDRQALRAQWGIASDALVIAASGGFNMTAGADWLVESLQRCPELHLVLQPLAVDPLAKFLLTRIRGAERMYMETRRLGWREAWASAAGFDVGLAVYTNPAPQFQHMGISSNRLCMYLAMGVPVIASRQPSFQFIEDYDCGVLVGSADEMVDAIRVISSRLDEMKSNALRCSREYINAKGRFAELSRAIAELQPQ